MGSIGLGWIGLALVGSSLSFVVHTRTAQVSWTVSLSCAALVKSSSSSSSTRASGDLDIIINRGGRCIAPVAAVSMHWVLGPGSVRWSRIEKSSKAVSV